MDFKDVKVGKIVSGTVVLVKDNEVLVDVGYLFEGTIYKDHLTLKKVGSCRELYKEGDTLKAKVTKVGEESLLLSCIDIEKKEIENKMIDEIKNKEPFEAKVIKDTRDGLILVKNGIELLLPNNLIDLDPAFDKKSLVGQTVNVIYFATNERGKLIADRKGLQYLEVKQARRDEFDSINEGDVIKVKVARITNFGAFVEMKYNDALLHFKELSHYHIKQVEDVVKVGDEIEVKVIKKDEKKINVSLKALQPTPWETFIKNHKVGDKVECTIVKKMQFGMLCEVERDVVGIINKADYSWNIEYNLAGEVEVGDKIELQITYIDENRQKLTLSKKHLEYNPWQDVNLHVGDIVSGSVERFTNTGVIIKVGNIEGFMHANEVSAEEDHKKPEEIIKVGDIVNAEVLRVDPRSWKLSLSMKTIEIKKNRETYEKYLKENVSASSSIADIINKK